jgi:hypothetical protein
MSRFVIPIFYNKRALLRSMEKHGEAWRSMGEAWGSHASFELVK